jgi:long-chain fatty acid transport protein
MRQVAKILPLVSALCLLAGGRAAASGFMVRENSAESIATVFAGNASRADDVSTVFNNPAGMSLLAGTQVEAGAAVVLPDMHFKGNATIRGNPIPGDNSQEIGQVALIPHFYGVFDLDDRTKLGLAITVPFGNTVDYGNVWSGRYVNIKTAALAFDFNPNISYRITDRVSIAGGISAQYLKLTLSSGIAQFLILGPTAPDGKFELTGSNWNLGYNLGILAEPMDGTRLGLTYRSGISHNLNGTLRFSPQTSPLLGLKTAGAHAPLRLPASITGSVTQQVSDDLSLSSDIQFTQWHVFQKVAVVAPPDPTFTFQENYRDSWMLSIGGVYRMNDTWKLRAGVGYDQSPVVDAFRDTGVPDKNRYMVGIGPAIQLSDTTFLDAGYAYYFGASASMDRSVNAVDPITGVVLHGHYNNALNFLSVTFRAVL